MESIDFQNIGSVLTPDYNFTSNISEITIDNNRYPINEFKNIPSSVKSLNIYLDREGINVPEGIIIPNGIEVLQVAMYYCPPELNIPISLVSIPDSVRKLTINYKILQQIVHLIPKTVDDLFICYWDYNSQKHSSNLIPSWIKTLRLSIAKGSEPLKPGIIPPNVTSVYFENNIVGAIVDGSFPDNVEFIQFDRHFNEPITEKKIPRNIKELVFLKTFNQPIPPGTLPKGLKRIHLGGKFNQSLGEGVLPEGITHITLRGFVGDHLPPISLPSSVTHLTGIFDPDSLRKHALPLPIKYLKSYGIFGGAWDVYPPSLESLEISIQKYSILKSESSDLPNLKNLTIEGEYTGAYPIDFIPKFVETLTLSTYEPLPKGVLPEGIKSLTILNIIDQPLDQIHIPQSLTSLDIEFGIDDDYIESIPDNLIELFHMLLTTRGHRETMKVSLRGISFITLDISDQYIYYKLDDEAYFSQDGFIKKDKIILKKLLDSTLIK
eukprot:gene3941-4923_t